MTPRQPLTLKVLRILPPTGSELAVEADYGRPRPLLIVQQTAAGWVPPALCWGLGQIPHIQCSGRA